MIIVSRTHSAVTTGHSDEKSIKDLIELDILGRIKELLQSSDSNSIRVIKRNKLHVNRAIHNATV
jgi:hypothetical protein